MKDDEITKLAREYVAEVYGGDTDFINEAENVIRFLLRTHCIVSKEKVRKAYDNANQGDAYDRFDNGYNLGVVDILESLFDAETFKNEEV